MKQICNTGKSKNPCRIFKDFPMFQICHVFSFLPDNFDNSSKTSTFLKKNIEQTWSWFKHVTKMIKFGGFILRGSVF